MVREYKDSNVDWIGQIPQKWKTEKFKHIFRIKKIIAGKLGYDVLSVTQQGLKVKNINEGQVANDYSNYQIVQVGDFVMNHMDLLTGYVDVSKQKGVTSPDYRSFNAIKKHEIDSRYYLYIFQFCYMTRIFYNLGHGVSNLGRWRLPAEQQNEFILPFPPLAEQRLIANYLDKKCSKIDSLVELQEQMIAQLTNYKQSVITEAVTKGLNPDVQLVPSDIDWIDVIPKEWNVCRIKDLVNLQSGTNLTTVEITDSGHFPVYGGNGIRGYYHQYSNDGDFILIGRQGALCGNINYASGKFWATEHAVVCYPKRDFARIWLGELLRAMNLGQYSLSAAQPGLAVERIKNLKMPLPPIDEQQAIAFYLDTKCGEIDKLIETKRQKIETLKEYKKSMIYEAVTGKIDVE